MESQEVIRRKNKDEKFESEDEHKEDIKDDKSNEGSEEEQIINRIEFKTVDDAYDKIKGNNRFTWFYAAPVGLVYCFSPVYVIPYMKQIPAVECSFNGGTTWSSCSKDYVCNSYSAATYRYDYDSISTVDNWITKMDLICITDFQIGLLGTLFFVGWVIGALTLLSLGDIIGRKKVLLFSATGFIFMACGLVIVDKLWLLYINLLLLGIFQGCKGALAYLYMLELAPLYMRPLLHMYFYL